MFMGFQFSEFHLQNATTGPDPPTEHSSLPGVEDFLCLGYGLPCSVLRFSFLQGFLVFFLLSHWDDNQSVHHNMHDTKLALSAFHLS
jgi:hypothetical protein